MLIEYPRLALQLPIAVFAVLVVVLTVVAVIAYITHWRGRLVWYVSNSHLVGSFTAGLALLSAITLALLLVPFKSEYWYMYEVDTTVESVTNTFYEASGELTNTPVVQLAGVDRPVTVKDPRIVNLNGRDVVFSCTQGWHYQAADTYKCKIREIKP